jgi:hypothetical protein
MIPASLAALGYYRGRQERATGRYGAHNSTAKPSPAAAPMSTAWECINDAHSAEAGAGELEPSPGELDPKTLALVRLAALVCRVLWRCADYDGFGVAAQGGPVWLAEPPAHQCVQRGAGLGVVPGGALWSPRLWLPGHYPGRG